MKAGDVRLQKGDLVFRDVTTGLERVAGRGGNPSSTSRTLSWLASDGNVWVGLFPQTKEILVGAARLGFVSSEGVGAPQLQMCQCAQRKIQYTTRMIHELPELAGRAAGLTKLKVSLAAHIDRVKGPERASRSRANASSVSHTPPWLVSESGCQDRRC